MTALLLRTHLHVDGEGGETGPLEEVVPSEAGCVGGGIRLADVPRPQRVVGGSARLHEHVVAARSACGVVHGRSVVSGWQHARGPHPVETVLGKSVVAPAAVVAFEIACSLKGNAS